MTIEQALGQNFTSGLHWNISTVYGLVTNGSLNSVPGQLTNPFGTKESSHFWPKIQARGQGQYTPS